MYSQNNITNLCVSKIKDNFINNIVCASLSYKPDYRYYWIRDSALVYRCLIDIYSKNGDICNISLEDLLNYIENETKIQNINTISGIGEPKVNIDYTAFNESWGRPQNDGPALRGLNFIKLYELLKEKNYDSICENLILPLILKDIVYISVNYKKPSFDLWEEHYGWHFYTRVVQFKFIKEAIIFLDRYSINLNLNYNLDDIQTELIDAISHHIDYSIISSFNEDGSITKKNDTSIILALCHTDFDQTIIELFGLDRFMLVSDELVSYFNKKYKNLKVNMVGRYENDRYYNGHLWIICSLGLAQFYQYLKLNKKAEEILKYILDIDENLDIAEQYDDDKKQQLSAEKLTWNYSELYFTINNL